MAAIVNATVLYQSSTSDIRVVLLAVRKVTTGDAIDLSLYPTPLFSAIWQATYVTLDNRTQAAASPTIGGTTLTFGQVGLANDSLDVLIVGAPPQ